jgi:hypothetical protein
MSTVPTRIRAVIVAVVVATLAALRPKSRQEQTDATRMTDNTDFRDGYAEGFVEAIRLKSMVSPEAAAAIGNIADRRESLTDAERDAIRFALKSPAERLLDETAQRWQREHRELLARIERADCPDWCTIDHAEDDARDDLVLHQGGDHTDGTVRKLLNPDTLDITVCRTDNVGEGRPGAAVLQVYADVELTTWQQAAELSRTILDAFGYLEGADRD